MCHHPECWHHQESRVFRVCLTLQPLALAETTESFITPSLQAYPCLRLADQTARRGSRPR